MVGGGEVGAHQASAATFPNPIISPFHLSGDICDYNSDLKVEPDSFCLSHAMLYLLNLKENLDEDPLTYRGPLLSLQLPDWFHLLDLISAPMLLLIAPASCSAIDHQLSL